MKYLSGYLLLIMLVAVQAYSQGDSELTDFQGGKYTFILSTSNNLFSGVGSRVGAMGGDYGGLLPSGECLLWNPANLAFINNTQWTIDFCPPLRVDPAAYMDIATEIRSAVDDGIADLKGPNFMMVDEDYPELALSLGTKGNFGTGSFAFKGKHFTVAGAVYQPFALNLDLIGTGMEARIKAGEAGSALEVSFFSCVDFSLSASIKIQGMSIGAGRMVTPRWAVGIALERLSGMAEVNGCAMTEGIMVTAGNERAFNDPNDPWYNDLHSRINGSYRGSATGFKFGTTYKLGKTWGIGAVLSVTNPLKMKGDLQIIQHSLPGLNLEAEGDADILDPTSAEFDLSAPTKTKLMYNPTGELLVLNLPNSFGTGISGKFGFLGIALNYTRYLGECSYRYDIVRNGEQIKYSQGIKLSNSFRLGLDFKYFRLRAGVTMGTLIDEIGDSTDKPETGVLIPDFALSTGFRIYENFRADIVLLAVPSGVGKISISYAL